MKTNYLKIKNWLMLSLAGIFGLQLSCSSCKPDEAPKCIYGPPEMLNGGSRYVDDNDSIPDNEEKKGEEETEDFDFGENRQ